MKIIGLIAVVLLLTIASAVEALTVSPMGVILDPSNGKVYANITAVNNSDRTIAIETYVERRFKNEQGKDSLILADDDFVVFPPLRSIKPGSSQSFRIQWIGELDSGMIKKYYVTIAQLPITPEELEMTRGPAPEDRTTVTLRLGYAFKVSVTVKSNR